MARHDLAHDARSSVILNYGITYISDRRLRSCCLLDLELVSGTLAPKLQIAIVRDVPRARINDRTAAARFWESCTMFACSPPMFPEWPVTTIELAVRNCGASFAIAVLDLGLTSAVPSMK